MSTLDSVRVGSMRITLHIDPKLLSLYAGSTTTASPELIQRVLSSVGKSSQIVIDGASGEFFITPKRIHEKDPQKKWLGGGGFLKDVMDYDPVECSCCDSDCLCSDCLLCSP